MGAPELGFEPRSEAPQASRISKLPHSGIRLLTETSIKTSVEKGYHCGTS